jgi:hypothetical protein
MRTFTVAHAKRLAEILEDHGWNIYNDGELYCWKCGETLSTKERLVYKFCPDCGASFTKKPPTPDKDILASTHRFIAECVRQAMEEGSE